jgi:hypothetical protein
MPTGIRRPAIVTRIPEGSRIGRPPMVTGLGRYIRNAWMSRADIPVMGRPQCQRTAPAIQCALGRIAMAEGALLEAGAPLQEALVAQTALDAHFEVAQLHPALAECMAAVTVLATFAETRQLAVRGPDPQDPRGDSSRSSGP